METQVNDIAKLNDAFRKHGLRFTITRGIQAMVDVLGVIEAVRNYADFNEDNDPYREHDFGILDWYDEKVYWKIDYYDQQLQYWCDPLSPDCNRVLTVMLSEEY
jgi:hypothetical protein